MEVVCLEAYPCFRKTMKQNILQREKGEWKIRNLHEKLQDVWYT